MVGRLYIYIFLLGWPIFRGYVSFRYKNIQYDCESTVPLGITKAFTAFTTSNNSSSNNNNNHSNNNNDDNSNNSVFWCFFVFFSLRWSSTNLLTTHSHAIGLLGRNLRERIWKDFRKETWEHATSVWTKLNQRQVRVGQLGWLEKDTSVFFQRGSNSHELTIIFQAFIRLICDTWSPFLCWQKKEPKNVRFVVLGPGSGLAANDWREITALHFNQWNMT